MKKVITSCEIDANVARVWQVLTDFTSYANWNPFITSITGEPKLGSRLSITIAPPDKKSMHFKPIITQLKEQQILQWHGKLFIPGVFDGKHTFELKPMLEDKTHFLHYEVFSGLLIPLVFGGMRKAITAGFESMNLALKQMCET